MLSINCDCHCCVTHAPPAHFPLDNGDLLVPELQVALCNCCCQESMQACTAVFSHAGYIFLNDPLISWLAGGPASLLLPRKPAGIHCSFQPCRMMCLFLLFLKTICCPVLQVAQCHCCCQESVRAALPAAELRVQQPGHGERKRRHAGAATAVH
jgi:hypothetical protein